MDKFETQFTDLDVQTSYMEDAMSSTTAVSTPQDQIEQLMRQTAEEANIEMQHDLAAKDLAVVPDLTPKEKIKDEDDKLADRLRALRPATWPDILHCWLLAYIRSYIFSFPLGNSGTLYVRNTCIINIEDSSRRNSTDWGSPWRRVCFNIRAKIHQDIIQQPCHPVHNRSPSQKNKGKNIKSITLCKSSYEHIGHNEKGLEFATLGRRAWDRTWRGHKSNSMVNHKTSMSELGMIERGGKGYGFATASNTEEQWCMGQDWITSRKQNRELPDLLASKVDNLKISLGLGSRLSLFR